MARTRSIDYGPHWPFRSGMLVLVLLCLCSTAHGQCTRVRQWQSVDLTNGLRREDRRFAECHITWAVTEHGETGEQNGRWRVDVWGSGPDWQMINADCVELTPGIEFDRSVGQMNPSCDRCDGPDDPPNPPLPRSPSHYPRCGNGILEGAESCDPGGTFNRGSRRCCSLACTAGHLARRTPRRAAGLRPFLHIYDFIDWEDLHPDDILAALRTSHITGTKSGGGWCSRRRCCLPDVERVRRAESGAGKGLGQRVRLVGWADARAVKAEGVEVERDGTGKWKTLGSGERLAAGDLLRAAPGARLAMTPPGTTGPAVAMLRDDDGTPSERPYLVVGVMADPEDAGPPASAGAGRLSK